MRGKKRLPTKADERGGGHARAKGVSCVLTRSRTLRTPADTKCTSETEGTSVPNDRLSGSTRSSYGKEQIVLFQTLLFSALQGSVYCHEGAHNSSVANGSFSAGLGAPVATIGCGFTCTAAN